MCSRHDAVQFGVAQRRLRRRANARRLWQLVSVVVRGPLPAPIDEKRSRLLRFSRALPCRSRKLWRLGAQIVASNCADLRTFFSGTCAECIRATWIVHGTRVRDCDSFRAFALGAVCCFGEGAAVAAPRGDGSVAGGLVMISVAIFPRRTRW